MKKVFFLIAFLFTVVCFAAPPPDKPTSFLTEDVGVIRSHGDIAVQTIEVQEVAFAYIGDCYFVGYNMLNKFNMLVNVKLMIGIISNENKLALIDNYQFQINRQNNNYKYPFGSYY